MKKRMNRLSLDAYYKNEPFFTKKRKEVYEVLLNSDEQEATLKEIASELGVFPHTISGRITELKDKGYIYQTHKRRDNSSVLGISFRLEG